MEKWKVHYKDKNYDIDCEIENWYKERNSRTSLTMCIDGVEFGSYGLDDWELIEEENEEKVQEAMKKFSLFQYGDKEDGYGYALQGYTLTITIPTYVWDIKEQKKLCGELNICLASAEDCIPTTGEHTLDGKPVQPEIVICKSFALSVKEDYFESEEPTTFFDTALASICKKMSGKYYLCNCFGCLYSDYSPYGGGNIGSIYCFVENAERYLKSVGKYKTSPEQITIWDIFNEGYKACQETNLCEKFAPRVNCNGGYRGLIYKEEG